MKPVGLHQLAHALFAGIDTPGGEFAPYPRPAISPLHLGKDCPNVNKKGHVVDGNRPIVTAAPCR